MSFTLATLKTAIDEYTQNTNWGSTTQIDAIIKQAEERINYAVQIANYNTRSTSGLLTENDPSVFLVTDGEISPLAPIYFKVRSRISVMAEIGLGSPIVTPVSMTGIIAGATVSGSGIDADTVISTVGSSTFTISPVASADVPLTLDVWKSITPVSEYYDDTGSTSFGGANSDYDEINEVFITTQDLSALRDPVTQGGGILGDFNDDQVLNADDIDLLTSAVAANDQDRRFDVNLDGAVSAADRDTWVNELKQTYFGDANLDDEFNSNDIVVVLTAGEYEDALPGNSTWATGDWNGDTEFTSSDLVTALTGGGYEMGPRQAVAAVPEPTSLVLLLIGLLPFWRRQP